MSNVNLAVSRGERLPGQENRIAEVEKIGRKENQATRKRKKQTPNDRKKWRDITK